MATQKKISFQTAAAAVIPFGPFEGKTIDSVGSTDSGLSYLDNVRAKSQYASFFNVCLGVYLDDPAVALDLEKIIEKRADY